MAGTEQPSSDHGGCSRKALAVALVVLAAPFVLLFLWSFLMFGTLKIVNRSDVPVTGGELQTGGVEMPIGTIAPGQSRRLFFRVRGEDGWTVFLRTARGEEFRASYGYYVFWFDFFINDLIVVTPDEVLVTVDGETELAARRRL